MIQQFKDWKTRTRNKFVAVAWIFIGLCDVFILIGWFMGKPDAPGMFTALNGSGGILGGLSAISIAIENLFLKKGAKSNENP